MDYKTILYEVDNGLAKITLNRPEAGNAINRELGHEFMAVCIRATTDLAVRCILVSGAGKNYGFGGDLKFFAGELDTIEATLLELTAALHQGIQRLHHGRAPVVIAVNGVAAGGGFSLALFGDIVIAGKSSKFVSAYTNAGLSPDGSSSYYLPRVVGLRRAQELMLTNRMLSADEALEWGLITSVVDDDALAEEAEKLGRKFAAGPTNAYAGVKRLLSQTFEQSLELQVDIESRHIAANAASADGREGLDAFVNKRKPDFKGE
ncbi:MAG: enoyl-CoA hydratase-related protein [Alphaproteobacteria bacterium]|nr:enoyl-CoA hydratase-related protein [Alphaproteobacteria bacterium]